MLGGVCAGVGRSAGLDPLLLRVAVVAVTVLTGGAGLLAYLAAWVLIPREPVDAAPAGTDGTPGSAAPDGRAAEAREIVQGTGAAGAPAGTVPAPRAPQDGARDGRPDAPGARDAAQPAVQAGVGPSAGAAEAATAGDDEAARHDRT